MVSIFGNVLHFRWDSILYIDVATFFSRKMKGNDSGIEIDFIKLRYFLFRDTATQSLIIIATSEPLFHESLLNMK